MAADQLYVPIASALGAIAILRLCHQLDLENTCTTQDNLFAAQPDNADRQAWQVRAQVRAYGGLGAAAWWVNLAQAAVLVAWSRNKANKSRPDALCVVLMALLAVWGDWHLVSGRCDAGVTPCGDARYQMGANNCAYPVDGEVGDLGDPVEKGCLVCDDTLQGMAWAGMGFAAAAVVVVAIQSMAA